MFLRVFWKQKKPFQTKKNKELKKWKNWDFSKGVSPWLAMFLSF